MDPAGPYYEDKPPSVILDPTDAVFVDVVHTDDSSILNTLVAKGGRWHITTG